MSIQFDHRQIADEMEIYFIHEQVGAGLPVWMPNGAAIREALEAYMKQAEAKAGYQRVISPHLAKEKLYERSGHLKSFAEALFPPLIWPDEEGRSILKPMNCPHHHLCFSAGPRSYRDLPLRLAEFGQVYRFEQSGALRGLSRVRGLCQNDAHVYIEPEKAEEEIQDVLKLHEKCYRDLGLSGYRYRLSKRDPQHPQDYEGEEADWIQAEEILKEALLKLGLEFFEAEGEAAFYAPKIDVQMRLADGREESIASVQLDFISGEKFDLAYINSRGQRQRPWVIHRAPIGSHERFIALLLEFYQGRLPGWLSPIQLAILPVEEKQQAFCEELEFELRQEGIRVFCDRSQGSLAKRIRQIHRWRPFLKMVVGEKEKGSGVFRLQAQKEESSLPRSELSSFIKDRIRPPGA